MSESLTLSQQKALAITPKCTASFSLPSSAFIIYEVYCDHRSKGTNAIQRAIVGMSVIDILSSTAWFLSSWAVPEGTFIYAAGNKATCNFQGFLLQLAIASPLYNCSLALYYLLVIKYRWSDKQLAVIEKWVHGFILAFSIGTSILLLPLEQYNQTGAVCWVIGDPQGCNGSAYQPSDVPCNRGENAWIYGTTLFYGPLWVCIIACLSSMYFIYRQVYRTQRRLSRYSISGSFTHSLGRSGNNTSQVAQQAILYSVVFLITWMPSTLWSIAHWFNWKHFALDFAAGFCEPLQGLWNLLIFARRRTSTRQKVRKAFERIMPCIIVKPEEEDEGSLHHFRRSSSVKSTQETRSSRGTEECMSSNHVEVNEPSRAASVRASVRFAIDENSESPQQDSPDVIDELSDGGNEIAAPEA